MSLQEKEKIGLPEPDFRDFTVRRASHWSRLLASMPDDNMPFFKFCMKSVKDVLGARKDQSGARSIQGWW